MGQASEPARFPGPLFLVSLGLVAARSLGNYTESRHIKREMKAPWMNPRGAGAGRALGAGFAWLWSCGGAGRPVVRRYLWRGLRSDNYRGDTAFAVTSSGARKSRSLSPRCGEVQPANHWVADVSVRKFRVAVLRAREYAMATAQAEMARIAARRLAALPPGWNRRSVVSSRRSAAVALCSCPSSLMPCLPPFSMVSSAES